MLWDEKNTLRRLLLASFDELRIRDLDRAKYLYSGMTTPAVPIASSSTIPTLKTRKPKKHKEKSRQGKAVSSSDADASATVETPAARNEENENENDDLGRVAVEELYAPVPPTGSISVMVAPEGSVLADTYDVEFGEFDYDTVKADDDGGGSGAELWLVRAPTAVRFFFFSPSTNPVMGVACPNFVFYLFICFLLFFFLG